MVVWCFGGVWWCGGVVVGAGAGGGGGVGCTSSQICAYSPRTMFIVSACFLG